MTRILLIAAACALAAAAAASADAAKGGPSPGVLTGWNGVAAVDGKTRFVSLTTGKTTTVAAIRTRDGTVTRYATIRGTFGVPLVAYDGSTAGLSHDGRTLVLATTTPTPGPRAVTRFAVLSTKNLRARPLISLQGAWAFDALSPDGSRLYLVEYVSGRDARYRVRTYDVQSRRLVREAVVDPRLGGRSMAGEPVTRLNGPGGVWAYTLYRKPAGFPFVHALNTQAARALCIELPWRRGQDALWSVRMHATAGGRRLVLTQRGARLAAIDLRTFAVRSFRKPAV